MKIHVVQFAVLAVGICSQKVSFRRFVVAAVGKRFGVKFYAAEFNKHNCGLPN